MSLPNLRDEEGHLSRYPTDKEMSEHLFEDLGMTGSTFRNQGIVFFEPDMEFIHWLKEYAAGRMVMEIGCGTGHVLRMLRLIGHNLLCGVEPQWDYTEQAKSDIQHQRSILQVVPWTVERAADFINKVTTAKTPNVPGCLLLFCRPCHSNFVKEAINHAAPGTEVMYITKPENLERYDDLGYYRQFARTIEYRGSCKDSEVVQVFVKP